MPVAIMTCDQLQFEIRTPGPLPVPLSVSASQAIVFKLTFEATEEYCPCVVQLTDVPSNSVVDVDFVSSASVDVNVLFPKGVSIIGPLVMMVRAPEGTRLICVRTSRVSSDGYEIVTDEFISNCAQQITFESTYFGETYEGKFKISYRNPTSGDFITFYTSTTNESIVTLDLPLLTSNSDPITSDLIKIELLAPDPYSSDVVLDMHLDNNFVCEKNTILTTETFEPAFSIDSNSGSHSLARGRGWEGYDANKHNWYSTPYTIECFVKPRAGTTNEAYTTPALFGNRSFTANGEYWVFGPLNNHTLVFGYWTGSWNTVVSAGDVIIDDMFNHIAMTFDGTTIRLFANRVLVASSPVYGTPQFGGGLPFSIWGAGVTNPSMLVDDILITKGVAKYIDDFEFPLPLTEKFLNFQECNNSCKPFNDTNWVGVDGTVWEYSSTSPGFVNHSGETHIASTYTLTPEDNKSFTVTFELFTTLSNSVDISWELTGDSGLSKSVDISWNLASDILTKYTNISWNIADGTGSVTKDTIISWRLGEVATVSKSSNISWNITAGTAGISSQSNIAWRIQDSVAAINKSSNISWSIAAMSVLKSSNISWKIEGPLTKSSEIKWRVL
jgi:hypothetical protein